MLCNGLLTEITISLHHPILKTLKRTEKPSTGEKREDWIINVMGMTFLMRSFLTTLNSSSVVYVCQHCGHGVYNIHCVHKYTELKKKSMSKPLAVKDSCRKME